MRKRWLNFISEFTRNVERNPEDVEGAATLAAQACFMNQGGGQLSTPAARKKGRALLNNPDIRAGLANYVEAVANFSLEDLAQKMVGFIEGGLEYEKTLVVVTKEGPEVIRYTEKTPPSEAMTRFAANLMLPKPPKEVHVDQRTMVAKVIMGAEKPKITARVLENRAE
jgi:hypothetical protein